MSTPLQLIDILGRATELGSSPASSASSSPPDRPAGQPPYAGNRLLERSFLVGGRSRSGGFFPARRQNPAAGRRFKLPEQQRQPPLPPQQRRQHPDPLAVRRFAPVDPPSSADLAFDSVFEAISSSGAGSSSAPRADDDVPDPSLPLSSSSSSPSSSSSSSSFSSPDSPSAVVSSSSPSAAADSAAPKSSPSASPGAKAKKRTWKKPEGKPRRPLSAYNLFFQSERGKIVAAKKREMAAIAQGAGEDDGLTESTGAAVESSSSSSPSSRGGGDAKKRPHRRTHGKIGFAALAQNIAAKWKALDDATRDPFVKEAVLEKRRYKIELEAWEKKRTAEGKSTKSEARIIEVDLCDAKRSSSSGPTGRKRGRPSKKTLAEAAAAKKGATKQGSGEGERPEKRARLPDAEAPRHMQKPLPTDKSGGTHNGSIGEEDEAAIGRVHSFLDSLEPINIQAMKTMMHAVPKQQAPPPPPYPQQQHHQHQHRHHQVPPPQAYHQFPKMTTTALPVGGAPGAGVQMSLRDMLLANQMRQQMRQQQQQQHHLHQQLQQQVLSSRCSQHHLQLQGAPAAAATVAFPPRGQQPLSMPQAPQQHHRQQQQQQQEEIDPFDANLDAIFGPPGEDLSSLSSSSSSSSRRCYDSASGATDSSSSSSEGFDDSLRNVVGEDDDDMADLDDAGNTDFDDFMRLSEIAGV